MFDYALTPQDGRRLADGIQAVRAHGLNAALAGSLARAVHLQSSGRTPTPRALNDVDLVVGDFGAFPPSLTDEFLLNHVHPAAREGQVLVQLVHESTALRLDVFRAFGGSLSRAALVDASVPLPVLAVEDVRARVTAMVCRFVAHGRPFDPKHLVALRELAGLGDPKALNVAWEEHRQDVLGSFDDAHQEACRIHELRPDLLVRDRYSAVTGSCDRCQAVGPLRPSAPRTVVAVLGYW